MAPPLLKLKSSWVDKIFTERKKYKTEHAKCQVSERENHICPSLEGEDPMTEIM